MDVDGRDIIRCRVNYTENAIKAVTLWSFPILLFLFSGLSYLLVRVRPSASSTSSTTHARPLSPPTPRLSPSPPPLSLLPAPVRYDPFASAALSA